MRQKIRILIITKGYVNIRGTEDRAREDEEEGEGGVWKLQNRRENLPDEESLRAAEKHRS